MGQQSGAYLLLNTMQVQINYLDLFSGAGGFAKGLLRAGFSFKQHYYSEIDTHAIAVYRYHFKKAKALGDIKTIKGKHLKNIDLITFGSPCQDISVAGQRKGFKGKRSGLFFEALRLITECKPRAFIFENVKGLFSSNKGKDFEAALKAFADIGLYNLQWQLLNTAWFLPQSRQRIYLVGTLGKAPAPKIFPLSEGHQLPASRHRTRTQSSASYTTAITSTYHKGVHGNGETYVQYGRQLRRLTPLECERLQGFPDHWTQHGMYNRQTESISDTQRYILLGNAVSVPVVKAVGCRLHSFFNT